VVVKIVVKGKEEGSLQRDSPEILDTPNGEVSKGMSLGRTVPFALRRTRRR